jgi:hypothetical protein
MSRITLISAVLIGLLLNKPSLAQEFPTVPNFIRDLSKAGLLGRETVQRELELTQEQIEAVRGIERAESAMRTDLTGLIKTVWPEERPAKAAEVDKRLAAYAKEVEKKLQGALAPNQLARLDEIYVQTRGVDGLFDPTIVSRLGLSDDQTAKLAEVRKKYKDAERSWVKSRPNLRTEDPGVVNAWRERRTVIVKEFEDAVLSSLTAEQRDQFKKLQGKPIDLSGETLSSRRGGRGLGKRPGSP